MVPPGTAECRSQCWPQGVGSDDRGFSLIEIVAASFVIITLAALVTIPIRNMTAYYRLSGDARAVSNTIAVAKLRAASLFTQTRVYVTLATGTYEVQRWRKTGTPGWESEGAVGTLSTGVSFGFSVVATPPPNTQATIAQAGPCHDDAGEDLTGTACILFNSRGLPVDGEGAPTGIGAYYLSDGVNVYASTVSATGMIRFWRTKANVAPSWALQ
jgi:type II secretory pathway pseudopilin PulG